VDLHRNDKHSPQRLDSVLQACLQWGAKDQLLKADVVVRRGLLVRIMLGKEVKLNVSLINGILLIEEYEHRPRHAYTLENYPGLAFESLCTTSSIMESDLHNEQRTSAASVNFSVDPDAKWLSIISRKLGDMNLIMSGEVDCVKGRYTGQPDTFLELKLRKVDEHIKRSSNAPWHKKAYLQCHLLGTSELLVGRHADGILQRIDPLRVADIPSKIVWNGEPWDPQRQIDRGYEVLAEVKRICSEKAQPDERIWRVEVKLNEPTTVRELTVEEVNGLVSDNDLEMRVGIVPLGVANEIRGR